MVKWLTDNVVLVCILVALLAFWSKIRGLFDTSNPQKDADLALGSNHLIRPEKPASGASASAQKNYAERMDLYTAAVAAHGMHSIMYRINPWGREDDLMKILNTAVQHQVSLSSMEAEYLLFSGGAPLLTHLQRYLSSSNYRWFLSHIKAK